MPYIDKSGVNSGWAEVPQPSFGLVDWVDTLPDMPEPVPTSVSRFQAQAALLQAGLLDQVKAYFADPNTDPVHKLAWSEAQDFQRDSPALAAGAAALGITGSQLDDLFRTASSIKG